LNTNKDAAIKPSWGAEEKGAISGRWLKSVYPILSTLGKKMSEGGQVSGKGCSKEKTRALPRKNTGPQTEYGKRLIGARMGGIVGCRAKGAHD